MDDVIELRKVVVYKYASMNIYVVSLCSLHSKVFILLNIYGDKEQSLCKSQVMSYFPLARIIQSFSTGFLLRGYGLWGELLMQDDGCKYERNLQIRRISTLVHVKSNITTSLHDPLIKVYHQCLQEQPIDMATHSPRKLYMYSLLYI